MKSLTKVMLKSFSAAARPYLRAYGLLQTTKVFNRSALVWDPGAEKIVVLAPHMDDEVIGCGGTLARHVAAGADITIVFLTDGRHGGKLSAEQLAAGVKLPELRRREAAAALAELNISKVVYLDAEDGQLEHDQAAAVRLREVLLQLQPQIVYLPYFLEAHPDHTAASPLLEAATRDTALAFQVHSYEVWTPLFPNLFVRIDATVDIKRRALEHYVSQLAEASYIHTALGLNAYRSNAISDRECRFVEAFCAQSLSQYLDYYHHFATRPVAPEQITA
ncbi:MAG: PIG-L family deacetylase [Sinobacteraceae bacterium]|nr:PIG-L family deacetylase [Nevskiaceae bacterium]MBV8852481.1 PIG-L family deacetylase [Nevskiaceae bacterium]MBV9911199.1 PIG-L family deacetylase [Nevskiaceae bacterium]